MRVKCHCCGEDFDVPFVAWRSWCALECRAAAYTKSWREEPAGDQAAATKE